ncbi:hypothetical protein SJ05684_c12030 [Sinorhizobium sojae CCBAU 05684]|uniref:Uncharacterized protein n=1 Tax=Sinorhizobium sojae CCBAU 05684 TaxID=716928 RepID=A0A249PBK7_9HYPH|nr:hypothetical protein SJ05684_c12030 [Sinorhizobium sojae CCBAU 05684]
MNAAPKEFRRRARVQIGFREKKGKRAARASTDHLRANLVQRRAPFGMHKGRCNSLKHASCFPKIGSDFGPMRQETCRLHSRAAHATCTKTWSGASFRVR